MMMMIMMIKVTTTTMMITTTIELNVSKLHRKSTENRRLVCGNETRNKNRINVSLPDNLFSFAFLL
jgi:hypothetical protein